MNHEMRRKDKRHYNSKVENAPPPHRISPNDWYEEWSKVTMQDDDQRLDGMKDLSIFYELEYWKEWKICHLLDPMHVFKNVAESLWRHITGQKDSLGARRDLQKCKISKIFGHTKRMVKHTSDQHHGSYPRWNMNELRHPLRKSGHRQVMRLRYKMHLPQMGI